MKKPGLWRQIAERMVVFLLLFLSGSFSLWTAKTASVGLPAPDKQEAQNYVAIFWFLGVLLVMGAVGVLMELVQWLSKD